MRDVSRTREPEFVDHKPQADLRILHRSVLPTSQLQVVYQPINQRHLWSSAFTEITSWKVRAYDFYSRVE